MQETREQENSRHRMPRSTYGTIAALCLLGLVVGYFYLFPPFPRTFVNAIITIHQWRAHPSLPSGTTIEIDDEPSLGKLSSYIPGAGRKRFSMMSGGWITGVIVELHAPHGEIVEVHISDDLADFSDRYGGGDGRVRQGFDRFLLEMLNIE